MMGTKLSITATDFYLQLVAQNNRMAKTTSYLSCQVSLMQVAQDLCIQPSDVLELIANRVISVRESKGNDLILYSTEINSLQKTHKTWLEERKANCFYNACTQFLEIFSDSTLVNSVSILRKFGITDSPLDYQESDRNYTPVYSGIVFQLSKNA